MFYFFKIFFKLINKTLKVLAKLFAIRKPLSQHQLLVSFATESFSIVILVFLFSFSYPLVFLDRLYKVFIETFYGLLHGKRMTEIGINSLNTLKNVSLNVVS